MEKIDLIVGAVAIIFVALVLTGLWSIVYYPHCGVLVGYVLLGVIAGGALLLGRWYKRLEGVGAGLVLLYLVVMWFTLANPGYLVHC